MACPICGSHNVRQSESTAKQVTYICNDGGHVYSKTNPNMTLAIGTGVAAGVTAGLAYKAASSGALDQVGDSLHQVADAGSDLLSSILDLFA